jgi:hypothetical protein
MNQYQLELIIQLLRLLVEQNPTIETIDLLRKVETYG